MLNERCQPIPSKTSYLHENVIVKDYNLRRTFLMNNLLSRRECLNSSIDVEKGIAFIFVCVFVRLVFCACEFHLMARNCTSNKV